MSRVTMVEIQDVEGKFTRIKEGKAKNRIYRVGLELEGGWNKLPPGIGAPVHDGSVRFDDMVNPPRYKGEITSEPLEISLIPSWIKTHYPQAVNSTCGLHIHVSFRSPLLYMRTMRPELTAWTQVFLEKWAMEKKLPPDHPIWGRLRGQSTYCQPYFYADAQARMMRKLYTHQGANRYTMINYCYGLHSTFEYRILPMFASAGQATEAVKFLLNLTNEFLLAHAVREKPIEAKIEADESLADQVEEIQSCV